MTPTATWESCPQVVAVFFFNTATTRHHCKKELYKQPGMPTSRALLDHKKVIGSDTDPYQVALGSQQEHNPYDIVCRQDTGLLFIPKPSPSHLHTELTNSKLAMKKNKYSYVTQN
jgi:hypothetical protein